MNATIIASLSKEDPKLTLRRLHLLMVIAKHGKVTAKEAAELADYSSVKYARSALKECIASGYIYSSVSEDDFIRYGLSPKGKKVVKKIKEA